MKELSGEVYLITNREYLLLAYNNHVIMDTKILV